MGRGSGSILCSNPTEHEAISHIREWLEVMRTEPEGYIKLSEVYHSLRRMLGDE